LSVEAIPDEKTRSSLPDFRNAFGIASDFILHAVLQDRVIKKVYPGVMHLLIFWGMFIQIFGTIINILQYPLFLPFVIPWPTEGAYLGFELIMDIGGLMILIGVLMAFLRRALFRPAYLINSWGDWYALGLLTAVVLVGFLAEGVRLTAVNPAWRVWSPVGNSIAAAFDSTGLSAVELEPLHGVLFWSHAVVGLLFVASIPFTKFRHMITGPLNILIRPRRSTGELETIEDLETTDELGAGKISEFSSQQLVSFDACIHCGRCESVCPASISGMALSPRAVIHSCFNEMHHSLIDSASEESRPLTGEVFEAEVPWQCTTCGACQAVCPMYVDPMGTIVDMRRYDTLTTGEIPGSVGETLIQMERRGNPWGLPAEDRAPYLAELDVRVLQPGDKTDVLLFLGCAYSLDARNQKSGRELIRILQIMGTDFAVLGAAEACCGETARRMGNEYVFQVMAEENIATFESIEFERLLTPCAHCYNTLRNEYPQFGGDYQVIHHSEFLNDHVELLKVDLNGSNRHRYTYHDGCYLGRHNHIYSAPRQVLDSIRSLERVEMPRHGSNSFCCGGGGGQMWMETDPNTRINHRRLSEAVDQANADIIVTACPYCLIMFEDAISSKGLEEKVAVRDLAEVYAEHKPE
jgi:Fe-S oxidoreductase/nitrate reductase gamma subunit